MKMGCPYKCLHDLQAIKDDGNLNYNHNDCRPNFDLWFIANISK